VPKSGEVDYIRKIGPAGARHALDKPFSDGECGRYLADLATIMRVLPPPPARILDLGVGPGWTSAFLARRGYEVVGQDICPDMIELANQNRTRYGAESVSFVVQDYESMAFREEFDAAFFYDALHHAEDERLALARVHAALKPGGVCVTIEPGEGHAAASIEVARSLGVTEKDMPPHHIISLGRAVGFQEFRVYTRPAEPRPAVGFGPASPLWPGRPARWKVAWTYARRALRSLIKGTTEADNAFLFCIPPGETLHVGNIVWMRK
jgi:SAM-dependent methyltransferase